MIRPAKVFRSAKKKNAKAIYASLGFGSFASLLHTVGGEKGSLQKKNEEERRA